MNSRTLAATGHERPILHSSATPQPAPDGPLPIRVAVVDDDRLLTEALRKWGADRADLYVVAAVPTVAALSAPPEAVDVVLLDVLLHDGSDPAANVHRLIERGYRVLVVTVVRDSRTAIATHAAGAHGYLTKDAGLEELASAIADIAAGRPYYSRGLAHAFLTDDRPTRPDLAPQERAVLLAYTAGMTLDAAARSVGVRPTTARTYLERVKSKYREAGRPADSKLLLAERVREDNLR